MEFNSFPPEAYAENGWVIVGDNRYRLRADGLTFEGFTRDGFFVYGLSDADDEAIGLLAQASEQDAYHPELDEDLDPTRL
jgi:hypothetical protein